MRFARVDGALRATLGDGETIIATPLTPTEFRWEGRPPGFLFVFSADSRTVAVRAPGDPEIVLSRAP